MSTIGYPLGVLIGVITGVVFDWYILPALKLRQVTLSTTMKISAQFLAIPTFWFGGPWVTTQFIQSVNFADSLPNYLVSLTYAFLLVIAYPTARFVIKVGNEVGESEGRKK